MRIETIIGDRTMRDPHGGSGTGRAGRRARQTRRAGLSSACLLLIAGGVAGYLVRDRWAIRLDPAPARVIAEEQHAEVLAAAVPWSGGSASNVLVGEQGDDAFVAAAHGAGEPPTGDPPRAAIDSDGVVIETQEDEWTQDFAFGPEQPSEAAYDDHEPGDAPEADVSTDGLDIPPDSATNAFEQYLAPIDDVTTTGTSDVEDDLYALDSNGADWEMAFEEDTTSNGAFDDWLEEPDEETPDPAYVPFRWSAPCGAMGSVCWSAVLLGLVELRRQGCRRCQSPTQTGIDDGPLVRAGLSPVHEEQQRTKRDAAGSATDDGVGLGPA